MDNMDHSKCVDVSFNHHTPQQDFTVERNEHYRQSYEPAESVHKGYDEENRADLSDINA